MSRFFLWIYMSERRVFAPGITEDEQIEMLSPVHSFLEIQSTNNWIPVIVWSLVRQRPHQTIQRQKDMSATAALIEPMTNPWISQQNQQSQWWFGLITVFVLHWRIWHRSSPKLVEMFHWERGEDESLNIQYLLSRISFYPLCILIIKKCLEIVKYSLSQLVSDLQGEDSCSFTVCKFV